TLIAATALGRAQRACEQDMQMAALLGIDVDRVISTTFVMGAALAAVAGLMVTLYYGVVDFFIGFLAGVKAFTAAVLGGIGSLPGAVLGGVLIGLQTYDIGGGALGIRTHFDWVAITAAAVLAGRLALRLPQRLRHRHEQSPETAFTRLAAWARRRMLPITLAGIVFAVALPFL